MELDESSFSSMVHFHGSGRAFTISTSSKFLLRNSNISQPSYRIDGRRTFPNCPKLVRNHGNSSCTGAISTCLALVSFAADRDLQCGFGHFIRSRAARSEKRWRARRGRDRKAVATRRQVSICSHNLSNFFLIILHLHTPLLFFELHDTNFPPVPSLAARSWSCVPRVREFLAQASRTNVG